MKKAISMLVSAVMVLSMGITGFAEESKMAKNEIGVIFNGNDIAFTDAKPMEKGGRVMVPFSTIFKEMGASVKYEDKTIVATLEDKTIKIKENQQNAELIKDGKSEMVDMKVPAFVDKTTNRSYVPVSTISQVFGFDVYWDDEESTVNVIDSKKLISEMDAKYSIYNKIVAGNKVDMEKSYKTSMDADLNMNIGKDLSGAEKEMILAAKANLEAISKGLNLSVKGNIKVDTTKSTLTDELGAEEKELENLPFEFILNSDKGKLYFNVPKAINGDESSKNTWMEMSMDPNMTMVMEQIKTGLSGKSSLTIGQMVYSMAWSMKDSLPMMGMDVYSYVKTLDKTYDMLIADELFKNSKEGNVDVHSISMNKAELMARYVKIFGLNSDNKEMADLVSKIEGLDYKFTIKEENGKLIDSNMELNASIKDGNEKMTINLTAKGNNFNSDAKINVMIGSSKIELNLKSIMAETSETAKSAPPAGANIVDLSKSVDYMEDAIVPAA